MTSKTPSPPAPGAYLPQSRRERSGHSYRNLKPALLGLFLLEAQTTSGSTLDGSQCMVVNPAGPGTVSLVSQ